MSKKSIHKAGRSVADLMKRPREMSVKTASMDEAKALAEQQAATYLAEWPADANAANAKYEVYMV